MSGPSPAMPPRAIPIGSWSRPKPAADRKASPMRTPLRGLLLSLPAALAIAVAATDKGDARRYAPYGSRPAATGAISHAPAAPAVVDPGPGPLKIPNAALEPVGWGDLDGWAGDDHASAFATFYASCRPIVRSTAFRLEAEHHHSARSRVAHRAAPAPAGDSRPVRTAL